jgi:HSP20 family protein
VIEVSWRFFDLFDEIDEQTDEFIEETLEEMKHIIKRFGPAYENRIYGDERVCSIHRPATHITETDESVVITVDLPFVKPEDIRIRLRAHTLFIEATTQKLVQGKCIIFRITVPVAQPIEKEKSSAKFQRGVLRIELKKEKRAEIKVE